MPASKLTVPRRLAEREDSGDEGDGGEERAHQAASSRTLVEHKAEFRHD
jgi:hypothetical protein